MESLDDVIDDLIADRVIRRHRRTWLIVIGVVVVLALVVLVTGGWKQRVGRAVPTYDAPATVAAGRWEFSFSKAEIIRTPKGEYSAAKAELRVYFDVRNIDTEEHKSNQVDPDVLRMVPGGGKELVRSNGASCRGESSWVIVYGLPPDSCFTKFEIEPDFTADQIEVGVLGEQYISDDGLMGANEDPYWHQPKAAAVVRLKPTVVVKDEEN
ncbi:hypothetical protein GCM10029976_060950 [Kribbella albertanoniae]|uniref:DUF4352 domain-containing protein n=1 Tax=Kribbella albertanoniae TaxID=1266829 RepID=A0A4R4PLL4_9ACTN|nr:hypothetical protein [Kribbella albertanoniae]TDC22893.1 hypothetical protein E1261_29745 [Kribbella albertanoniae]